MVLEEKTSHDTPRGSQMIQKALQSNISITYFLIVLLLCSTILPSAFAETSTPSMEGFSRGITWKPYIPLKKITFIDHDPARLIDDYGYLASIPTSIFYDENTDQIYTHPLLYYDDRYVPDEEEKLSLNARQGIDYFMEDYISYADSKLDQLTLINVEQNRLDPEWQAQNYTIISESNPASLAKKIALQDWSYSDQAVIAVIEPTMEQPTNTTYGTLSGTVPNRDIVKEHFEVPKTNKVYPTYHRFTVPEGYKFLKVRSWYPCFYLNAGLPGFEGIVNMSIPAGDRDLQIYCKENDKWMMAGITNAWNAPGGMDIDKTSVYVYKSGDWSVALTDVPTKTYDDSLFSGDIIKTGLEVQKHRNFLDFLFFGRYGRFLDILKNMRQVIYQIDVEMYPGVMLDIPEKPPFGCRHGQFEITWDDPSADLGISLIGPSGEEVLSTREEGVRASCHFALQEEYLQIYDAGKTAMIVQQLGECRPDENYKLCVFSTNELDQPVDFTIQYSWEQNFTRSYGDGLASASNGAIYASLVNAPLLYVTTDTLPECTKEAITKLGVTDITLIDLHKHLQNEILSQLQPYSTELNHITEYSDLYDTIRERSHENDIIFTTFDPYSYWYIGKLKAEGELPGATALGPAAYLAAHHGSPLLIIDNHPELSSAIPWHNELWGRHPDGLSKLPTVSEMYLTGTRVYDFLKDHEYDREGLESLVTVAGQFDIGLTWDRVFVGKAKPGRFIGTPTDLSVWISKSVFYPQLIFENPALKNPNPYKLINGSSSERRPLLARGKFGLKITKESQEEEFQYPVLDTLICYDHKFNSRASDYWGFKYKTADGDIPGETQSLNPIDEGVMLAVNGEQGGFLPDLSGSEVQPFYLKKAGYDPVYSTSFEANMENLNRGVLLWIINTHGGPKDGGLLMFWDVNAEGSRHYPTIPLAGYNKETNPWRGYEWLLGSTEEPDTMTSEIHGIAAALAGNPDPRGLRLFTTALDWATAKRPVRDIFGKLSSLPLIRHIVPDWFQDTQDYYDGVIISVFIGRFGTSWYSGPEIEAELDNLHSIGVSSVACLPAGKYLHLSLMRHGSVFQIMDPWATSWYSDVWQNGVPRGIALGQTIGEIYTEGISKVGILYITDPPQWWWDLAENVCLYGDPDLRIWVPSTEYSSMNHWEQEEIRALSIENPETFTVSGHMPFGAHNYPNAYMPTPLVMQIIYLILIIAALALLIFGGIILLKRRR